jgi:hypothetical protein
MGPLVMKNTMATPIMNNTINVRQNVLSFLGSTEFDSAEWREVL